MNFLKHHAFFQQSAHLLPKLGLIGLLVSGGLYYRLRPAYACSCLRPESPVIERDRATAVFSGEVLAIGPDNSYDQQVVFSVTEAWKGSLAEQTTVRTANNSAACGYSFEVGEQYLVYANGEAESLEVYLCSRTTALAQASEDIAAFSEAPLPAEEMPSVIPSDSSSGSPDADLPAATPDESAPTTDLSGCP